MDAPIITQLETVNELAARAISAVLGGDIDPIKAHICMARMERAIKIYKDNEQVRDITIRELSKYGDGKKSYSFGDCTLQECETGVKYDYSSCGDPVRDDLAANIESLTEQLKEREKVLKALPVSGLADTETGVVMYPPAKSSKTSIKTTFKNK